MTRLDKMLVAREVLDEMIARETKRQTGDFTPETGRAAINERWRRHREAKAK